MTHTLQQVKDSLQRRTPADYAAMGFALLLFSFFFLNTDIHRVLLYLCLPVFGLYLAGRKALLQICSQSTLCRLAGFFCLYALISLLWSEDANADSLFRVVKSILFLFLFTGAFLLILLENRKAWIRTVDSFLHLAAFFAVVILAYNYFYLGNSWRIIGLGRIENSIECAMMYGLALIFLWSNKDTVFQGDKHGAKLRLFYTFLFFMVMVLTFSRGPLLAYGCSVVLLLAVQGRWRIVGAIAVCGIAILLSGLLSLDQFNRGDSYRLDIWKMAIDLWKEAPLLGHGFAMEHTFRIPGYTAEEWSSTHNLLLGTAVYGGVIGAALLIALFTYAFLKAFAMARKGDALPLCWLVFGAVLSLFQFHTMFTNLNMEWLILWLPLAYVTAASIANRPLQDPIPRSSGL